MEKVIEELRKVQTSVNKAVSAQLEQQATFYNQQISSLRQMEKAAQEEANNLKERYEEQKRINSRLQVELNTIKEELENTKKKIILSKDNQNTAGRPSLNDEEIRLIRQLLNEGLSMRKVSEMIDISLGSVHKYSQEQKKYSNAYGDYKPE